MVEEKTLQLDEKPDVVNIQDDGKKEKSKEDAAGMKEYARILSYSDKWDWIFNGVGAIAAIASGASLAL